MKVRLCWKQNESNEFYTKFPQILDKEKIMVKKIVSDDDSLDSLYSKLVEKTMEMRRVVERFPKLFPPIFKDCSYRLITNKLTWV